VQVDDLDGKPGDLLVYDMSLSESEWRCEGGLGEVL
jgi:hypothetical protein